MAYLKPDIIYNANGLTVKQFYLNKHNDNKISLPTNYITKLEGITIHNTDSINVKSDTTMAEQYSRATYNGNMNNVIVQFYVDNKEAWHIWPCNMGGWHAADGNGKGNTATISIEVIGNTAEAEENAAKLAAWLCDQYKIGTDKIFTHTYWLNVRDNKGANLSKDDRCVLKHSYKTCPIYIIPHWKQFLAKIDKYITKVPAKIDKSDKIDEIIKMLEDLKKEV